MRLMSNLKTNVPTRTKVKNILYLSSMVKFNTTYKTKAGKAQLNKAKKVIRLNSFNQLNQIMI